MDLTNGAPRSAEAVIVDKLAQIDADELLEHIERLRPLGLALLGLHGDAIRAREITEAIGRELDSARHIVRPYYKTR